MGEQIRFRDFGSRRLKSRNTSAIPQPSRSSAMIAIAARESSSLWATKIGTVELARSAIHHTNVPMGRPPKKAAADTNHSLDL